MTEKKLIFIFGGWVGHKMTTTLTESLSALLELGEKNLNEGDYLKLASFLQGLKDSSKPVPYKIQTINMDITLEFETTGGNKMRICIDSFQKLLYGAQNPNKEIIKGSINGIPVEMEEGAFIYKVMTIYRLYGMRNIKRSTTMCEPFIFEYMKDFKDWCNEHMKEERDYGDDETPDAEDWNHPWLFRNLCGLADL